MKEVLDIVKALVSPIEKLIDTTRKGVGVLYEPRHKRKMADAAAYEINTIGEALRNNSDVIVKYNDGSIDANIPEFKEFVKRTQHRFNYQELQKQYNIECVVDNAYDELESEENVSSEDVDADWINRFFNSVGDISNKQMQLLWGKILANEIKKPHSFSLRTLEVVKNLTQNEASLFFDVVPFILQCAGDESKCFDDYFLPSEDSILQKCGISFSQILVLNESGIIFENGLIGIGLKICVGETEYIYGANKKISFYNSGTTKEDISHPAYILTESGKELFPIVKKMQTMSPPDWYVHDFLNSIAEYNSNVTSNGQKKTIDAQIIDI